MASFVTINNTGTANGTFSGSDPDVFTPTGDNAVADSGKIAEDLRNGFGVIINTASGSNQPGDINIESSVAGSGALTLNAAGGISQSNGSTITASTLTGSANGPVNLVQANAIGTLGNFNATSLNFTDTVALALVGAINVNSGILTLNQAGSGANGTIAQAPGIGSSITASMLTGSSNGAASFTAAGNVINNLGSFTTGGGDFTLTDNVGSLNVSGPVNVGSGTLTLTNTGGSILGSQITAATLVGSAVGSASFSGQIGTLAGFSVGGTGFILNDTAALSVTGTVDSSGGNIYLNTNENDLTLTANLIAGSTPTSLISLTAGRISQGAGSTITAGGATFYADSITLNGDVSISTFLSLNSSNPATVGGVISGSGGLNVSNGGTVTLTGVNNYSGPTSVISGSLSLVNGGSISQSAVSVAGGATFDISGAAASASIKSISGGGPVTTGTSVGTVTLGANTLTLTAANNAFAGTISGAGGLSITGGAEALTGANNYTGATTIGTGATLQLGGGGTTATTGTISAASAIVDNGTLTIAHSDTLTLANSISGSGSLLQAGSGTTILTGANSFQRFTTIAGGTLQLGDGGTSGTVNSGFLFGGGGNGKLVVYHSDTITLDHMISGAGTLQQIGTGTLALTAQNINFNGNIALNAGTLELGQLTSAGTTALIFGSGAQTLQLDVNGSLANTLTGFQTGDTIDLRGLTSAGATVSYDAGLHTLTVTRGATIDTLHFDAGFSLPSGYGFTTADDGHGGTALTLSLVPTQPTSPAPPASPTQPAVPTTGGTASPAAGETQTVDGITSGSLTVDGPGKLILTGTSTYTGPTDIKAGTLSVNGSIISPVTVETGGTLGGSGSTGTVTVESGGTLSPGNSPGVLTTHDLTLAAGAALKEELGGTGQGQFDQTKVIGSVALNGATLNPASYGSFVSARGDHFTIIDNDGTDAVQGTFNGLSEGASLTLGAHSYQISYHGGDGNDVVLTDVTLPPAATLALFGSATTNPASQTGGVYALYQAVLGRAPDPLGLEGFSANLQAGAKLTDVAAAILGSAEHGPAIADPSAYVQSLYTNVLHRAADASGLQFFTGELAQGVNQATVAVQIATSPEAQANLAPVFSAGVITPDAIDSAVARLYYGVLGRAPDAGGLANFEASVKVIAASGGAPGAVQGLANAATAMLGSTEYQQGHAGQTDTAFVTGLYQGALGRAPDAGGQAVYLDQLAHGVSRAQVALEISQSPEAQVHLVGVIEQGFHLVG